MPKQYRTGGKCYTIDRELFYCPRRYVPTTALGRGSFGLVCAAKDRADKVKVAIKKVAPMAKTSLDAKHILREIRLMRYLGKHPNIIGIKDLFLRPGYDEIYIVMDFLDTDLHRVIQSEQPLSMQHNRHFMFQILQGIKYMHSCGVLHRDLKPGNLLVTKTCELVIADFGLARSKAITRNPMTQHVVTRWYRPPELMLCPDGKYNEAIDVWSTGCIFAELLGRTPLFPGENFLIFDVIGTPKIHEISHIKNKEALKFLEAQKFKPRMEFVNLFPKHVSKVEIDLLEKLLVFSPADRLTISEALKHPYFDDMRNFFSDYNGEFVDLDSSFEESKLLRKELRDLIIGEVKFFRDGGHGGGNRNRQRFLKEAAAKAKATTSETAITKNNKTNKKNNAVVESNRKKSASNGNASTHEGTNPYHENKVNRHPRFHIRRKRSEYPKPNKKHTSTRKIKGEIKESSDHKISYIIQNKTNHKDKRFNSVNNNQEKKNLSQENVKTPQDAAAASFARSALKVQRKISDILHETTSEKEIPEKSSRHIKNSITKSFINPVNDTKSNGISNPSKYSLLHIDEEKGNNTSVKKNVQESNPKLFQRSILQSETEIHNEKTNEIKDVVSFDNSIERIDEKRDLNKMDSILGIIQDDTNNSDNEASIDDDEERVLRMFREKMRAQQRGTVSGRIRSGRPITALRRVLARPESAALRREHGSSAGISSGGVGGMFRKELQAATYTSDTKQCSDNLTALAKRPTSSHAPPPLPRPISQRKQAQQYSEQKEHETQQNQETKREEKRDIKEQIKQQMKQKTEHQDNIDGLTVAELTKARNQNNELISRVKRSNRFSEFEAPALPVTHEVRKAAKEALRKFKEAGQVREQENHTETRKIIFDRHVDRRNRDHKPLAACRKESTRLTTKVKPFTFATSKRNMLAAEKALQEKELIEKSILDRDARIRLQIESTNKKRRIKMEEDLKRIKERDNTLLENEEGGSHKESKRVNTTKAASSFLERQALDVIRRRAQKYHEIHKKGKTKNRRRKRRTLTKPKTPSFQTTRRARVRNRFL